ncbi:MAG: glycoside hydrolase domain-containing protein [bacterium]
MIQTRPRIARLCAYFVVLLMSVICTTGVAGNDGPSATVYPCGQPPTVDGALDDPCWVECVPLQDFTVYTGVAPAIYRTSARITYDSASFYLAVACESDKPPQSTQTERDHPDIWRDDHIEVSINPTPDSPDYYHLQINTNETWLDQTVTGYEPRDTSWDIDLHVEVDTLANGYTMEVAIPFDGLGSRPEPVSPDSQGVGPRWGFNICRGTSDSEELSCWSRIQGTFFAPELFGSLIFDTPGPRLLDLDPLPTFPGSHAVTMRFLPTETNELDVKVLTTIERERGGTVEADQAIRCYSEEPYRTVVPIVVPDDARAIRLNVIATRDKRPLFSTGRFPLRVQPTLSLQTEPLEAALAQLDSASATADVQKVLEEGRQTLATVRQVQTEREEYFSCFRPDTDRWQHLLNRVQQTSKEIRRAFVISQTRLREVLLRRKPSDYAVLVLSPMTKVERSAIPPGIVDGSVTIELARSESESAQFTIWPFQKDLENVTIHVNDLIHSEKKGIILSKDVDIHLAGFVDCRPPQYDPDLTGSLPDPLFPYMPFSVQAGTHQPVWLTLHTSRVTPPGTYQGSIEIHVPDQPIRTLPLFVRVYEFLLERTHLTTAFALFENEIQIWYGLEEDIPQEILRNYYEFLLSYRLNPTNIYASGPRPRKEDIQFCLDRGMTAFNVKHIPRGVEWTESERNNTLAFFDVFYPFLKKQNLLNSAYCYSFDEPNSEDYPKIKEIFGLLGSRYPGLRRATTEPPTEELDGVVDIYVPLTSKYDEADCRAFQKKGDEIWWYVCLAPKHPYANFFVDYQGIDHRILFWQTWKYKVTGFLYYAINLWRTNRTTEPTSNIIPFEDPKWIEAIRPGKRWPDIPWNSYTYSRHNGDGHLIYPGPDCEPYPSIRLALIRDGIEDYEYLYLLQERLNALLAKKDQSPGVLALTDQAAKLVAVRSHVAESLTKYTHDPDALMMERRLVAELIERIDKKILELK